VSTANFDGLQDVLGRWVCLASSVGRWSWEDLIWFESLGSHGVSNWN